MSSRSMPLNPTTSRDVATDSDVERGRITEPITGCGPQPSDMPCAPSAAPS